MAKLILIKDNGESLTIRDNLPGNVVKSDILYKKDYMAMKLWDRNDVEDRMEELSMFPSKSIVDSVCECIEIEESLEECDDRDWYIIDDAIKRCSKDKADMPAVIEDFAKKDECIVKLILEGDYSERYVISDDKDISDLGAAIEMTLHRILNVCRTEYNMSDEEAEEMISTLMGASKDNTLPINVDLGWYMPSILIAEVLCESSSDIYVIQNNNELFANYYGDDEPPKALDD